MFFKHWPILLVDDEPDVLSVSKLAMKNFGVYGLPLKIYTAASKAEAIDLMKDNVEVGCSLAVAFIDVVMESDHAGLELCDYIRNTMDNKLTQVFVRTGQAGLAPEREVIDKYDINGYFTKVEATEDKLYSLIKSSVRQYLAFGMSANTITMISQLVAASGSRRKIVSTLSSLCGIGPEQKETPRWIIVDGEKLFDTDEYENFDHGGTMHILIDLLLGKQGLNLGPAGDRYVQDSASHCHMIHVPGIDDKAEISFIFKSSFDPPMAVIEMLHSFAVSLAIIWKRSEEDR